MCVYTYIYIYCNDGAFGIRNGFFERVSMWCLCVSSPNSIELRELGAHIYVANQAVYIKLPACPSNIGGMRFREERGEKS